MHPFFTALFLTIAFLGELQADQWSGFDYAQHSSVQLSHAERLISTLDFCGDESILDIGCGDGKITLLLAEKVPQGTVIGIDPSKSMLAQAQEKLRESGTTNLTFIEGSAENFSLSERFDHITAIHVMHWIVEQEKALKNICDHLKPGGHFHFILAPSKEGLPFHRALLKTLKNWKQNFEGFINPQQVFDMEGYRKLLVDAGFHIDAIHYIYHESHHESREKLEAWIRQWLPHGKHLPCEKREAFFDELMDNYLAAIDFPSNPSSPIPWGEYVLFVEGIKNTQ